MKISNEEVDTYISITRQ